MRWDISNERELTKYLESIETKHDIDYDELELMRDLESSKAMEVWLFGTIMSDNKYQRLSLLSDLLEGIHLKYDSIIEQLKELYK